MLSGATTILPPSFVRPSARSESEPVCSLQARVTSLTCNALHVVVGTAAIHTTKATIKFVIKDAEDVEPTAYDMVEPNDSPLRRRADVKASLSISASYWRRCQLSISTKEVDQDLLFRVSSTSRFRMPRTQFCIPCTRRHLVHIRHLQSQAQVRVLKSRLR